MSDYTQYLEEKKQIDIFLKQGYIIKSIMENLNGDYVEFSSKEHMQDPYEKHILHVTSPDARKYFSVKLIEQQASLKNKI